MEALTKSFVRPPLSASASLAGQPSVAVKSSARGGSSSSFPSVSKAATSAANRTVRTFALPNDDDVIALNSGKSLEELEETIRRIAEENEQLRARAAAAAANARRAESAFKGDVDVSRPRMGAVPPPPPPEFSAAPAVEYLDTTLGGVPAAEVASVEAKYLVEEAESVRSWQEAVEQKAATSAAADGNIEIAAAGGIEDVQKTENPMSIVFVASEVAPYSKTGGLADVVGSLPVALAARGHRVMVVAPRYMNGVTDKLYAGAFDMQCRIKCFCFEGAHEVAFFHEFRDGVDFVFVDHPSYHRPGTPYEVFVDHPSYHRPGTPYEVFVDHPSYHRPGTPYGDQNGTFGDNQFRFTLLCHAACEAPLQLELGGFTYGEKVLFIANDWHAGLLPVLVASNYRPHGVYKDARTILAIHNLSHQVRTSLAIHNLSHQVRTSLAIHNLSHQVRTSLAIHNLSHQVRTNLAIYNLSHQVRTNLAIYNLSHQVRTNLAIYNLSHQVRTNLAIYNLSHQGVEPGYTFGSLGVPDDWYTFGYTFGSLGVPGDWYGALEWVFPEWARKHELDKGEAVNILKGAIVTADRIVTVSPVPRVVAWQGKHELDKGEAVNILKGAIVTADRIVTVSPLSVCCSVRTVLVSRCRGRHELDKGEAVNILEWAIADRIVTVTSGYAWEIATVEGGWGPHLLANSTTHLRPSPLFPSSLPLHTLQGYAWEITTVEGGWGLDGGYAWEITTVEGESGHTLYLSCTHLPPLVSPLSFSPPPSLRATRVTNGVDVVDWNPACHGQACSAADNSGSPFDP
ncbi:unnamed protein product [Closterium sp. Naga37s-1]|nr:unnamed protein product [Closterium sp. Naga37s-1]